MTAEKRAGSTSSKEDDYLHRGARALEQGEYDMAIQYFRQLVKWSPNQEKYRHMLSQAELEKAKSQVNFITRPLYLVWGVFVIYILRMYKAGKNVAKILAKSSPGNKLAVNLYAACCFKTGEISEAIQTYEIFLKEKPFDEGVLEKLSKIYYDRIDYPNAVRTLDALRRLRPEDVEISKMYDVAVTQKYTAEGTDVKKLQRIEQERQKVEAKQPKLDEKKVNLLIEQCKQKPDDVNLRYRLGRMLMQGQQWEQSAGVFEAALDMDPNNQKVMSSLVEVYDELEQKEQAVALLEKLKELNPEDQSLAKTLLDRKISRQEAMLGAEEGQEKTSPEELEALRGQKLDIEIEEYLQKIKDNPANADLQIAIGKLYQQKGELDEAIKSFQMASRNPTRAFIGSKLLGETFYQKGMLDIANEQLVKALDRATSHREFMTGDIKAIHYLLSQIQEELGDLDKAIEYLQPIYEEDINFRDVQKRFEKLYEMRREGIKKASTSEE